MNLAQRIKNEGIEEGRREGAQEAAHKTQTNIALDLLAAGADPLFVAKMTKLPIKEVMKLKDSLLETVL